MARTNWKQMYESQSVYVALLEQQLAARALAQPAKWVAPSLPLTREARVAAMRAAKAAAIAGQRVVKV